MRKRSSYTRCFFATPGHGWLYSEAFLLGNVSYCHVLLDLFFARKNSAMRSTHWDER